MVEILKTRGMSSTLVLKNPAEAILTVNGFLVLTTGEISITDKTITATGPGSLKMNISSISNGRVVFGDGTVYRAKTGNISVINNIVYDGGKQVQFPKKRKQPDTVPDPYKIDTSLISVTISDDSILKVEEGAPIDDSCTYTVMNNGKLISDRTCQQFNVKARNNARVALGEIPTVSVNVKASNNASVVIGKRDSTRAANSSRASPSVSIGTFSPSFKKEWH